MATAEATYAELTAEFINPVITSVRSVFETMIGCSPKRLGLQLKDSACPSHELSAVIGVTGKAVGTIVVSFSRQAAFQVYERFLGATADAITPEVCDAMGELANMIAGGAKSRLETLNLSIGLPTVISGVAHEVHYPSNMMPLCVPFESEIGNFSIEIGFRSLCAE